MGKDNRDRNTIRPYKGAMHGEDWDTYIIDQMRRLREMKEKTVYKQYNEKNFRHIHSPDTVAVVSGGFDPIHAGHLALIREATNIGKVHVLLNSDTWLKRKKGRAFLDYNTRADIISEFLSVHAVTPVNDEDGTVTQGLEYVKQRYPHAKISFLNGGDRKPTSTPERDYCERNNIKLVWNVGGEKLASSSDLLEAYTFPVGSVTIRPWGEHEVIGQGAKWRGKILRINPGRAISLQRHFKREERWIVVEGEGEVWINKDLSPTNVSRESIQVGSIVEIAKKDYHWLHNTSSSAQLVIVEVWLGEELSENDIERVNNDEASVFIEK